jgi:hypothetical protein
MNFFSSQPQGIGALGEPGDTGYYDANRFPINGLIVNSIMGIGIAILAGFIAQGLRINALAMIIFAEVFWLPYLNTLAIFDHIFVDTPLVFSIGFVCIFTTLMVFCFIYALLEMSSSVLAY